jgi:hypothetical protein
MSQKENISNESLKTYKKTLTSLIRKLQKTETYPLKSLPKNICETIETQLLKSYNKMKDRKKKIEDVTKEEADKLLFESKYANQQQEDKLYKAAPDLQSDEEFNEMFGNLSLGNSCSIKPSFFLEDYELPHMQVFNDKSSEFLKLFLNQEIIFCYKLCTILYDLAQSCLNTTTKRGEFLKMSENMFDITAVLLTTKKLESNLSHLSFCLMTSNEPVMKEQNIFSNYDKESEIYYTNVLNYSYDDLIHKSEVFYDLITVCYLFYVRGQKIENLRRFFFKMFNLIFIGGMFAKCLLSLAKYSNIVSMSCYSKSQNLLDKYICKNLTDRSIHYYYAREIFASFQHNIRMKEILEKKKLNSLKDMDLRDVYFKYLDLEAKKL